MKRKVYDIPVSFTFDGIFSIKATSAEEAREYADRHCGMVIGLEAIQSSLPDDDVDWNFPTHPRKVVCGAGGEAYTPLLRGVRHDADNAISHVVSRDGKSEGKPTGGRRPCHMEGCTGVRIGVRWGDGKLTWPCTKSLSISDCGRTARLM